jgi:hypothetical protein
MSFELGFLDEALEWHNPDNCTRQQLKKQLAERAENLRVPLAKFSLQRV